MSNAFEFVVVFTDFDGNNGVIFSGCDIRHRINISSGLKAGNKAKIRKENGYQSTVLFADAARLENSSVETQLENFDDDTEVLDVPFCIGNVRTQTEDNTQEEVVLDSDDEGVHVRQVTNITISSAEFKRNARGDASDLEKRWLTSPLDQVKDLAACSVASAGRRYVMVKGSDSWPNSLRAGSHYQSKCDKDIDASIKKLDQDRRIRDCSGNKCDFMDKIDREDTVGKISPEDTHCGKRVSSSNCEAIDGEIDTRLVSCDCELTTLSYVECQEPEELSQANALDFVDRYVSLNRGNFTEEVEKGKVNKIRSPPVLSAKGPQSLARRANLRNTLGEPGIFEWVDNQIDDKGNVSLKLRNKLVLNSKGQGPRSVTSSHGAVKSNCHKQESLRVECKEKLQAKVIGLDDSDFRLMVHNSDEITHTVQISEKGIEPDFAKELNKQFDAESSGQQLEISSMGMEIPDMFNVGFDTQMAAEAMESLFYAPFPNGDADFVHQGPQNTFDDSPTDESKDKASKCQSSPNGAYSEPGITLRVYKRTKRPAKRLSSNIAGSVDKDTTSQRESESVISARKKVKGPQGRNLANTKQSLCGGSSKVIYQRKKDRAPKKDDITDINSDLNLSMSVECNLFGEGLSPRKSRNSSPTAHWMRHWSTKKSSEQMEDQINNYTENKCNTTEIAILKKGRKSSRMDANVSRVSSVRGKHPKLSSGISVEATNSKVNGQFDMNGATTTCDLKLDTWSYPKRKRTRQNVFHQSNTRSNLCVPSAVVNGGNDNGHSVGCQKNSEGEYKASSFSLDIDRKAPLLVYTRWFRTSSENKRVGNSLRPNIESSSPDAIIHNPAVLTEERRTADMDKAKASWQSGKLDNVASAVLVDDANQNIKIANWKAKEPPINKDGVNFKRPHNKNVSRSPLMKELFRLGIFKSLPDFVSKDLRERRNMAKVRVLFSQNLDDDILKQQKKIVARLGISIASCCSDATHFIADRFVRTKNMLETIALGKPVVTHLWLESCGQANCFMDEKNYILRDAKKEKELGFSMPISLARAGKRPLLKGQRVFVTPTVQPDKELIESLVKAVHGQAVERIQRAAIKNEIIPADLLLLSCEQDYEMCLPFLEKGAKVYSTELLLRGIIIQKLEYKRHQLFTNYVKNCSNNLGREDGEQ
ncbi:unnamed protein product [Ilex paraguariensis]|uniref:BRCT domain-containing protein n=1 Tax=Ilex paraguariensis TaxID=185542 RepID=A0ABC8U456_9AQUA